MNENVETEADEYPDQELLALTGRVAYREFENAPKYSKEKLRTRLVELTTLSNKEFVRACESAIYDSALMQRFRGNHEDIHCVATACYHQSELRRVAAGHDVDCRAPTLYSTAYDAVISRHGMTPQECVPCACPNVKEK